MSGADPSPPAACQAQATTSPTHGTILGVAGGTALLLLLLAVLVVSQLVRRRRIHILEAEADQRIHQQIRDAIATTSRLRFPGCFVAAADFVELGALKPHEELRNAGKLVYRDTFESLHSPNESHIFLSHQWVAGTSPDPTGAQYAVMKSAIYRVAKEIRQRRNTARAMSLFGNELEQLLLETEQPNFLSWDAQLKDVLVWVDYSSIPQAAPDAQRLAIESICACLHALRPAPDLVSRLFFSALVHTRLVPARTTDADADAMPRLMCARGAAAYCSCATAFIIVAPDVMHRDTHKRCSLSTCTCLPPRPPASRHTRRP